MEDWVRISGNGDEGFELDFFDTASQPIVERTLVDVRLRGRVRVLDVEAVEGIDLAKLRGLDELDHLLLGNSVRDLTPLARLTGLKMLDLSNVENLDVVGCMSGLRELNLESAPVRDIARWHACTSWRG